MALEAQIKWTDGFQFVGRSGDGPAIVMDSTEGGSGPSPLRLLLLGVAGCTGIDVVLILQKKRLDLRDLKINITGEQAETDPQRFTKLHIEYRIYGTGIKPKAVEQAIRLSEEQYCSALASLNAEFSHSYQIFDESGEPGESSADQ